MVFIKLTLRNTITSSTKCLLPSLTFIIGANTTPGSTQRSLMSYFHLLLFLLHFAALLISFLDSVLTLYWVVCPVLSLPWTFEQVLPFSGTLFPFYWSYLLLNLQFSGWARQPSLWRNTLSTSFQNSSTISCQILITVPRICSWSSYRLPQLCKPWIKELGPVHCLLPNA